MIPMNYTHIQDRMRLVGQTFGYLTVIGLAPTVHRRTGYASRVLCRCVCGKELPVFTDAIKRGNTKSCGCKHSELMSVSRSTHGHSSVLRGNTKVYRVWANMIQRCTNPNHRDYKYYGGRGILVCDRWKMFENFFADMGHPPDGLTIERMNNSRGYCPDNCEWKDRSHQAFNRRPKGTTP